MEQLAFYNAGCETSRGPSRLKVLIRRGLRKILIPMFHRLAEILGVLSHRLDMADEETQHLRNLIDDLRRRQEEQAAKVPSTLAFGWDYVAMVRRLAILEEHVDALMADRALDEPAPRSKAG